MTPTSPHFRPATLAAGRPPRSWRVLAPIAAATCLVAGCGGGGSSDSGTAAVPAPVAAAPTVVALSGVAATGAPMPNAVVKVFDQTAAKVCETTTAVDGQYSCTLDAGAKAPLTIVATLGEQSLYSSAATAETGTVNITPLTNLIAARLSPSGDPSKLVEEIHAHPEVVDKTKLDARVEEIKTLLKPLMDAVGDSSNPITGKFDANGSGHDKLLDALQINIRPEGQGSNIDITVKAKPADDASAPIQLSFKNTDVKPEPLKVEIKKEQLSDDGVATRLAAFLARADACYALPLAQRIANVAANALTATGGPGEVLATECKGLFVNGDPLAYRNNGLRVGSSGDFSGLYRDGATGVKFDRGNVEYQLANGDLFVTYRSTTKAGVSAPQTLFLRPQDGQLRAVGNQYAYEASVRAFASDREFPFQPQYNWFGSGYNVSIANRTDASTGLPIFKEALVTAPNGAKATYRPNVGRSSMGVVINGQQKVWQVQFLAAAWQDSATPGVPADKESAFFVTPQRSDDDMRAIPDQGVWTIELVHADATQANVVQTYRTISRALTLGEVRKAKFAQLTADARQQLLADTEVAAAGGFLIGPPSADKPSVANLAGDGNQDTWTVPDGALSPTTVSVFGRSKAGVSFNDSQVVALTDRKVIINCSPQSSKDSHCDTSTGKTQFSEGSLVNAVELWARSLRQVEFQKQINLYKINL